MPRHPRDRRTRRNVSRRSRSNVPSATMSAIADAEVSQARALVPRVRDPQPPTINREKVYTFQRSLQAATITFATAPLDTFGSFSFRLQDLPDYTEFTNLFDEYRIRQVEVTFIPTSPTNYGGALITVVDYDDAVAPASIASLMEYQTAQMSASGALTVRRLTPKLAVAAYSGAFTSYALQRGWVDSGSPGVLHYGLKYGITGVSGQASTPQYVVTFRFTVECRNVL